MRLIRWMKGVSSKPFVVTNATWQPVRSISAFVPTVVPCVNVSISAAATPPSSSALTIACPGRRRSRRRLQRVDLAGRRVEDHHVGERPARVDADRRGPLLLRLHVAVRLEAGHGVAERCRSACAAHSKWARMRLGRCLGVSLHDASAICRCWRGDAARLPRGRGCERRQSVLMISRMSRLTACTDAVLARVGDEIVELAVGHQDCVGRGLLLRDPLHLRGERHSAVGGRRRCRSWPSEPQHAAR